jgi:hypothetical protein
MPVETKSTTLPAHLPSNQGGYWTTLQLCYRLRYMRLAKEHRFPPQRGEAAKPIQPRPKSDELIVVGSGTPTAAMSRKSDCGWNKTLHRQ